MRAILHYKTLLLYLLSSPWFCQSLWFPSTSSSSSSSSSSQKQWKPVYEHESETSLKENHLLKTVPNLGKEWKIKLDLMLTRFLANKDGNILWILSRQGFTLVTIGLSKTKHLSFCFRKSEQGITLNCDGFHRHWVGLNRWLSLEISQFQESGRSKFLFRWVGVESTKRENSPPETLKDVLVYASVYSDPMNPSYSQPGKIRRLSISIPATAGSQTNADSSWGDWVGTWTNCSATCGGGVSIKG